MNRYSVDVDYFQRELRRLSESLDNRTPEELSRYLRRLAETAHTEKKCKKGMSHSIIWVCIPVGMLVITVMHLWCKGKDWFGVSKALRR